MDPAQTSTLEGDMGETKAGGHTTQEMLATHPDLTEEALEVNLNVRHVPDECITKGGRDAAPLYVPMRGADVLGPSYT